VKVENVLFDEENAAGIVLLTDEEGKRILPIWVGLFEAKAILLKLRDFHFPRPLTHDLIKNIITQLKATVDYVLINEIKDNTFYAKIFITMNESNTTISIDSRPSDAIALALRTNAKIYIDEAVFSHSYEKKEFIRQQQLENLKYYLKENKDIEKIKH
jgi:bifunctional DNase/RNase